MVGQIYVGVDRFQIALKRVDQREALQNGHGLEPLQQPCIVGAGIPLLRTNPNQMVQKQQGGRRDFHRTRGEDSGKHGDLSSGGPQVSPSVREQQVVAVQIARGNSRRLTTCREPGEEFRIHLDSDPPFVCVGALRCGGLQL
jgi:hypothetical protein